MKHNPHIAILTGGFGAERKISLLSAQLIHDSLSDEKYHTYVIDVLQDNWVEIESGAVVDLNTFSICKNGKKVRFDAAYLILHGTPAEDGKIQAYLDMKRIPYTGSNSFVCALTFNKDATKKILRNTRVPIAIHKTLSIDYQDHISEFKTWEYPLFVKPNKNGSSYGVTKVRSFEELVPAIELALEYDDEILVEVFLDGIECSCGAYRNGEGKVVALPITEIIPNGDYFNYEAKYHEDSREITPARFSESLTKNCQELNCYIYEYLKCEGFIRIDYIMTNSEFYFLEVNTIPGLSPQSMIPQQVVAAGLDLHEFFENELKRILPTWEKK